MTPLVGLGTGACLADTSLFWRAAHPAVAPLWTEATRSERLVSCGALALEVLFSGRNAAEVEQLHAELTRGMRFVEIESGVWRTALRAQLELAGVLERFHRRPPIDYLIAATAHHHGLGVLHYDRDYDLIAEHSSLEFESRWVSEPGSL